MSSAVQPPQAATVAMLPQQHQLVTALPQHDASQSSTTVPMQKKSEKEQKMLSACSNCRRVHKFCSKTRPCDRCVKLGMADQCVSIPRKRRRKLSDKQSSTVSPANGSKKNNKSKST